MLLTAIKNFFGSLTHPKRVHQPLPIPTEEITAETTATKSKRIKMDSRTASFVGAIPSLAVGSIGNAMLTEHFFALAQKLKPTIFCDIGANTGQTAIRAAGELKNCQVYGFEANATIFTNNEKRVKEAGVNFQNLALSENDGSVDIYVPTKLSKAFVDGELLDMEVFEANDTGKSSLLKRNENAEYVVQSVAAKRLDTVLQLNQSDTAFLWIDVEGAAQIVLNGAPESLRLTSCIYLEIEGYQFWDQGQLAGPLESLIQLGFTPILRDREYYDAQFNVLLVKDCFATDAKRYLFQDTRVANANPKISVPILVPTFNNPTFSNFMVEQLKKHGFIDIRVVDNASTTTAMKDWLEEVSTQVSVVRLQENLGPNKSIFRSEFLETLPQHFIVTDPDIQFNSTLPSNFLETLIELTELHAVGKAGFALDISRRHLMNIEDYKIGDKKWKIWEWEEQFWGDIIGYTKTGDPVFSAWLDTTFALYNQRYLDLDAFLNSVRVGGTFTAQHLPWYKKRYMTKEEEKEYSNSQSFSFYFPKHE